LFAKAPARLTDRGFFWAAMLHGGTMSGFPPPSANMPHVPLETIFGKYAMAESGDVKATNSLDACRCFLSQQNCEGDFDTLRKFAKNDQATELLDFCHIFLL
jgi:hypothetical protein